jgi:hypothetical protein
VTRQFAQGLVGYGEDLGNKQRKVTIANDQGKELFSAELVRQADGGIATVTHYTGSHPDAAVIGSTPIEPGEDISLNGMMQGAATLQGLYSQAEEDFYDANDTKGCTVPGNYFFSCLTGKGACCDQHDDCLALYNCAGIGDDARPECKACTDLVKECMLHRWPGNSRCCAQNNCGDAYPPYVAPPKPAFPNPTTKTGLEPSLGIPKSPVRTVVPQSSAGSSTPSGAGTAKPSGPMSGCSDPEGESCPLGEGDEPSGMESDPEQGEPGSEADADGYPYEDADGDPYGESADGDRSDIGASSDEYGDYGASSDEYGDYDAYGDSGGDSDDDGQEY